MHVKQWDKFFKYDFKLGEDFKIGRAQTIILIVFLIQKSTLLIKFINICENYGTSFLR